MNLGLTYVCITHEFRTQRSVVRPCGVVGTPGPDVPGIIRVTLGPKAK